MLFTFLSQLHCCGVTNYGDWKGTNYYSETGFPKSCCKLEGCYPQRDADKVNEEVRVLLGLFIWQYLRVSWNPKWTQFLLHECTYSEARREAGTSFPIVSKSSAWSKRWNQPSEDRWDRLGFSNVVSKGDDRSSRPSSVDSWMIKIVLNRKKITAFLTCA